MSGLTGPIWAADFSDPTWPCIQRKVETLSLGLMWAHEVDPSLRAADGELATDAASLADLLALRRVELSDLEDDVAAFGAKYDGNAQSLGLVFELVFDRLSKRRGRIIGGIGEFSLSQIALAEQIDANRLAFDTEMAAAAPDFDKVDALEEKIDWDQVIYSDRQRSITYLCETPQLIEKRLFAIAQMLSYQVE
ncbi:MAG: hypothetical protein AAGF79_07680 [Pseudomonadota bacterium]